MSMTTPAKPPLRSKSEAKADVTDKAARAMIGDEAARREAKTARLRAARLEMEAREAERKAAEPAPTSARKRKAKAAAR